MKLQQMGGGQYFIAVPKAIALAKGWKKGDRISVEIDSKGNIILKKG